MPADFKVRLKGPDGEIVFEASSPLSESRQAEYNGYSIVHLPTSLISYYKTGSRTFQLNGKLVSRTADEATANANNLDTVRRWLLPDFGGTGATPPILTLYGYRNTNIDGRRVVLRSYGWNFTDDIDYIFTGSQPMPIIGNLELQLEEVYSAEEITAGAWRMTAGSGGSFVRGADEQSNSFEISGLGYGRVDPLSTTIPSAANMSSVMSALGGGSVTIPGVIAGTIARTLGTAALNSPAVREITSGLPPVLKNIFVGGANVAIGEVGKTVTTTVSTVTSPTAATTFGREPPFSIPGLIGG